MNAIILAAGRGSRLGSDRPKCLVEVGGQPLIRQQLAALRQAGVERATVVVGYRAELVREALGREVAYVDNTRWATTNSVCSLSLAARVVRGPFMLVNSDTLAHPAIYAAVAQAPGCALAYDSGSGREPEHMKVVFHEGRLAAISKQMDGRLAHGENVGILKFDGAGGARLGQLARELCAAGRENDWAPAAVAALAHHLPVRGIDVQGLPWTEIDFPDDVVLATTQVWPQILNRKDSRVTQAQDLLLRLRARPLRLLPSAL